MYQVLEPTTGNQMLNKKEGSEATMLYTYFRKLSRKHCSLLCRLGASANLPVRREVSPADFDELMDTGTGNTTYLHEVGARAYHCSDQCLSS
jgi:hypothetical protein